MLYTVQYNYFCFYVALFVAHLIMTSRSVDAKNPLKKNNMEIIFNVERATKMMSSLE